MTPGRTLPAIGRLRGAMTGPYNGRGTEIAYPDDIPEWKPSDQNHWMRFISYRQRKWGFNTKDVKNARRMHEVHRDGTPCQCHKIHTDTTAGTLSAPSCILRAIFTSFVLNPSR
jgi:hypothetical protein